MEEAFGQLDLVFKHEAGRLQAYLLRRLGPRHFDLAEDAVAEAFLAAAKTWPVVGAPRDARAWLLTSAHRVALDRLRRAKTARRKAEQFLSRSEGYEIEPLRPDLDDDVAVLLLACHPALPRDSRVALTLRTLAGLSTREVARALLIHEATAAQRIVRAKHALSALGPIQPLTSQDLPARIDGVLDVLYLVFTEGHHASEGEALVRLQLVADALHLAARLAKGVARIPAARTCLPRIHALLALMHFHSARLPARTDALGDLVLLAAQDRSAWEPAHLAQGFLHLDRAASGRELSRFHLEAGIAATHACARSEAETDWPQILSLYDDLLAVWPTPVVLLNRAVAVHRVRGPASALESLAPLDADPAVRGYAPYFAVRAELLHQAGQHDEATLCSERALACPCSLPQRRFLERRLRELAASSR